MINMNFLSSELDTPKAAWIIVVAALALLILIRRGFRGVNVGGVSVGVN